MTFSALRNNKQQVDGATSDKIVDGATSDKVPGTVIGTLLFQPFIDNLRACVELKTRLFANVVIFYSLTMVDLQAGRGFKSYTGY